MKGAFVAIIAMLPSLLHASMGSMVFKGSGTWKDSDGNSGYYKSLTETSSMPDGSLRIFHSVQTEGTEHQSVSIFRADENGTLRIFNTDGAEIGTGYCFTYDGKKVCHTDTTPEAGVSVECTKSLGIDGFHEMGSSRDGGGHRTMWTGYSRRIYPAK